MTSDLVELLGAELMDAARRADVVAQLERVPVSVALKRRTYLRWCRIVGAKPLLTDLDQFTPRKRS